MIVGLKLSRAPSYGLFAALLLLLLLLFSRTEDRHRHSSASVAGEPTRRLPPLSGAMGACDGQDCIIELSACVSIDALAARPTESSHPISHPIYFASRELASVGKCALAVWSGTWEARGPGLRARPLSCACGKGGGHGAQYMSLAESIESRSTLSRRTSYCMGMGADCVYVSCNLGARMVSARYELK